MRKLADMLNNISIITFTTIIISLVAVVVALYLYRPQVRQLRFGSIIIIAIIILGSAGFKVLASHNYHMDDVNHEALDQYKLADWVIAADQPTSSLHVKHAWQQNPTLENKLFYTFALLKNNNVSRGKHFLEEMSDVASSKHEWLDHDVLQTLIKDIKAYDRAEVTKDKTDKFIATINDQLESFKEHIATTLKMDQQSLEMLTQIDINRVQALAASGNEEAIYDVHDQLNKMVEDMKEDADYSSLLKKEIAKTAYFIGNSNHSEDLLIDVVLEEPTDQEAISLLADIYLRGDIYPAESAKKLPQYHHAQLLTAREKMHNFQEWKNQKDLEKTEEMNNNDTDTNRNHTDNETEERPDYLLENDEFLANEMTYTLIQSLGDPTDNPEIDIKLSRYHFNKGENDEAKQHIQTILRNTKKLSTEEQYMINAIEYHDEKLKQSIETTTFSERQAHLQEIYHSKTDLFNSFQTPSTEENHNIAAQSYEHFLAESIRNPELQSLSIMTIDAEESGSISMYVNTENIDTIDNKSFDITDNGNVVDDFTIEKVGEHFGGNTVDRSIGLVVDVSGSMSGERIKVARNSSKAFIHRMSDYEQGELVKFESFPTLVESFTGSKQALINGVNSLESGGGTNITDALLYEMDRLKDEDGHKVLFIFSDGEDDNFSRVESRSEVIDLANQYGISIFAVGFGAGYETLSEVASETGGMYIAAPNAATIDEGFKEVEQALDNTYKVDYKLEDPEKGKHIVKIDYKGLTDKKHYYLGEDDTNIEIEQSGFQVSQLSPSMIYQRNKKHVKVTLSGTELDDISSISIGQEDIKIDKIIDDKAVDILVPGDLTLGKHLLIAKSKNNEQSDIELTVSNADPKDEVSFGWATLYADLCKTEGNEINCMGDPSIDRFIYPDSSNMTLTDNESLSFNGARFNIDQTKLTFFQNGLGVNSSIMNGDMTLTKKDEYGEAFSLSYDGRDELLINKLGIPIQLNDMTYTAHPEQQPGTFTSQSKLNGIPDEVIDVANVEGFKVLSTLAPFLSTDLELALTISPTQANVKGSAELGDLKLLGLSMKQPLSSIEYDDLNKRFAIEGEFGKFSFLGQKIDAVLPIKSAKYSLGYEPGFRFKLGLTLNGNYPLGTTGLSLTKIGGHIDWTSRREAGLEAEVGTVANEPVKELIRQVNSIKIASFQPFNIDPDAGDILALGVDGNVANAFTSNWEATGSATGKVLGFEFFELSGRINNYLLQSGLTYNSGVEVEGESTIIYEDPNHGRYLTAHSDASISKKLPFGVKLTGEMYTRFIPASISRSNIRLVGKAGPFEFSISTDDLNLFK